MLIRRRNSCTRADACKIVRGTLEYCILLMLDKKVYYGYEILQELSKYPIITSTESTVYPLLRRLQKENYLQSTWQESTEGLPPRKYYSLTPDGKNYLDAMNTEWENLLNAMSSELVRGNVQILLFVSTMHFRNFRQSSDIF